MKIDLQVGTVASKNRSLVHDRMDIANSRSGRPRLLRLAAK